jgi:hypothetical protein
LLLIKNKSLKNRSSEVKNLSALALEAFLEDATKEEKRVLLMDHIKPITVLRDEKKFTFRSIAEWFCKKGIEVDPSAIYRAYLASIPEDERRPGQDWSDIDV